MISKNQSKAIRALHQKKERQAQGLFLAEGRKALQELAAAPGWQVQQYVLPQGLNELWATNVRRAAGISKLIDVTEAELQQLTALQANAEGLAVVVSPTYPPFTWQPGSLVLALDGIRDPGNLGTLIRLADWFGVQDILCSEDTVEWQNPKVIQATMGSFLRVRVHYGDLRALLSGIPNIYGALLEGRSSYDLPPPC